MMRCVVVSVACLTFVCDVRALCVRVCVRARVCMCMCVRAGLRGVCLCMRMCMRGGRDDDDDRTSVTLLLAVGVLCAGACCSCV